jgi:hypothetical protein
MQTNTALIGLSAVALGTATAGFVTGRTTELARVAHSPSSSSLSFGDLVATAGLATGMTAALGGSVIMGSLFVTAKPVPGFGTAAGIASGVGIAGGAGFLLGTLAGSASARIWNQ